MSNKLFSFGPNDTERQVWGTVNIEGVNYDLSHLNAHKVVYEHEGEVFVCYVTYSHHCFTKTEEGYNNRPELMYHHPKDPRHFHQGRYDLSFNLRGIIETLPERFVFHGGHGNYCSAEHHSDSGQVIHYKVVFNVFKSNRKFRLHVNSAYLEPRGKARKVGFMKILKALRDGRKLPRP